MTVAALAVAALAVLLAAGLAHALIRQAERHNSYTATLLAAFREERAQLINKITRPEQAIPTGREPHPKPRRDPVRAREFARVGTVSPPRNASDEFWSSGNQQDVGGTLLPPGIEPSGNRDVS